MRFWHMFHLKKEIAEGQKMLQKADSLTVEVDARVTRRRKIKMENHLGENVKRAMGG